MGVRRYHNKWRCYIVDKKGEKHQLYFDTEEDAQAYFDLIYADKMANARYKKKSNAGDQTLPVGLHLYHYTSKSGDDYQYENYYTAIKATVSKNGKVKQMMRNFGIKRTKQQAVAICLEWRNKQLSLSE